jgi:tRNA dimethylallyltransferase
LKSERAILIAGPTASGKSALAIALARELGGLIVNADSMQVYRELRILTARPTVEEERALPHRLYGHVSAAEAYSTGRWLADVEAALAQAASEGSRVIVVGGTGLYFKALLEGLSPIPSIPAAVRAHWREAASSRGAADLHAELARRDTEMAARLVATDTQRIVRALEVLEATGLSLAEWQRRPGRPLIEPDQTIRLVLAPERAALVGRCDLRFDAMLAEGALAEVSALAALDLDPGLPAMGALGVPPLMRHLRGELALPEAAAQAKSDTRHYVKRQLTWLKRHMIAWIWLDTQSSESIERQALSFIRQSN